MIEETASPLGEERLDDVTAKTTSPVGEEVSENLKPVIVQTKSESLDKSLEYGCEEENTNAHGPAPRDEVDEFVDQFGDPGDAVVGFWRKLNSEGRFSCEVVIDYWEATTARTDPVIEGLKRAVRFFG